MQYTSLTLNSLTTPQLEEILRQHGIIINTTMLDYKQKDLKSRLQIITDIASSAPSFSPSYLDEMANYIIDALPKAERKQHYITTDNR